MRERARKEREREADRERWRGGGRARENEQEKRERERERERGKGRAIEREGGRGGEITSTSAQSEIFKPSHSHITNSSIYCRCKLTWSPMYCTNRFRPTEILMAGHNRQDQH